MPEEVEMVSMPKQLAQQIALFLDSQQSLLGSLLARMMIAECTAAARRAKEANAPAP